MTDFKIIIVGSGPAGLSAATHAAKAGMTHVLLERAPHLNDTIFKYQKRKLVMAAFGLVFASMFVAPQAGAQETKTAKERSSRKWFDEQRLDNCRVPAELRGTTPRPGCTGEPSITAQSGAPVAH